MSILTKHKIGTLKDAYDTLLAGGIICNPKYSPYKDPKFKYCKMQLLADNSIISYGIGKVLMVHHFIDSFKKWIDGWELYYPEMYNDKLITVDSVQYRLPETKIKDIKEYIDIVLVKSDNI